MGSGPGVEHKSTDLAAALKLIVELVMQKTLGGIQGKRRKRASLRPNPEADRRVKGKVPG